MENFSPVDGDKIQETKPKIATHEVASFATIVALSTLVTLVIKLIRIFLKWK